MSSTENLKSLELAAIDWCENLSIRAGNVGWRVKFHVTNLIPIENKILHKVAEHRL